MNRNSDLVSSFKELRRTTIKPVVSKDKPAKKKNPSRIGSNSPYDNFLYKYQNLDEYIDKLNTSDLVFYFREVSKEEGFNYVITNLRRDARTFRRILENFSKREVCAMIEFLFRSEQDYLSKYRLTPNLLCSNWVNTIYPDMKLWLEDKYVPKSARKRQKQREWSETVSKDTEAKIGVWE